jgi:gluconate 5-dehydrogenase
VAAVPFDVTDPAAVAAAVARIETEVGPIDVLVNNAGVQSRAPFTEVTDADWEEVRGVVLDGALWLTRAVIGSMVKNKFGRILFFTGEGAFVGGNGRAHVSAAKMGLVGLTRVLAAEGGRYNIQVNAIAPGFVKTHFSSAIWDNPRINAAVLHAIPQHRIAMPEEVTGIALYLASDASSFTTGATFVVDGGQLVGSLAVEQ